MTLATPVRDPAPPTTVERPFTALPAGILAGGLALLAALLGWHGADTPNVLFRVDLFRRVGFAVWDLNWYGGHYALGYSALLPPLGALVGPVALGVVAAVAAAVLFDRVLASADAPPTPRRWATLVFAAGTVTNLAVGRLAFAMGLPLGLAAVLAAQRGRWRSAVVLSALTALASPVAGAFLALAWTAMALSGRPRRDTLAPLIAAGAALAPIAASSVLFPEGGEFPFEWAGLAAVVAACAVVIGLVPRRHRAVRLGAGLYALAAVGTFLVANPLGANMERLGMYLAAPLVIALAPRRRWFALVLAMPFLLLWQWAPAVDGIARAGSDPSADPAYYQPLLDFLAQQPGVVSRIEIPFTQRHFEAAYVAPTVPLARGWERQLDMADNALFYQPGLDASSYQTWLLDNGVEYVALADTTLDPSAVDEARVVAGGPWYLTPVWHNDHWRVWRVVGSTGLVAGRATLTARDAESVVVQASVPGPVLVRVRWTPYWSVTGDACVTPGPNGWTVLAVRSPGPLVLGVALLGDRHHCPGS